MKPVEVSLFERLEGRVESCAEVLQDISNSFVVQVKLHELAPFQGLGPLREHLFHKLGNLLVIDVVASVLGQPLTSGDHKVHQAAEQAIKEEVKLVSVELCLGLETEKEHYVYGGGQKANKSDTVQD